MQMSRTQHVIDKMLSVGSVYAAESGMFHRDVYVQVPSEDIGPFYKMTRELDLETNLTRKNDHLVGEVDITTDTLK